MAVVIDTIAIKDGDGNLIVGGVNALDLSGLGTGPWQPMQAIVDGLLGVNRAAVDSSNRLTTHIAAAADSIAKAEDAVHASTDVGVMALAVRKNTPVNLANNDGDYEPLQVSIGGLWVRSPVDATGFAKAEDSLSADADVGVPAMATRSSAPVDTSGTNGDYEFLRIATGRLWVSGQPYVIVTVTLTLDTAIYATGDLLADTQAVAGAIRVAAGFSILDSICVLDEDDQGTAIDLIFLGANNTLGTENAAPSVTDANARDILGIVSIAAVDFKDLGGSRVATVRGVGLMVESAATTIYVAAMVMSGTPTYTASGIKLKLGFRQA